MRRRNVPCSPCGGGSGCNTGCCSLKDKLAILWDRTIGSILKINNVTPDGDGNFAINEGENIRILPDGNGIEISAVLPASALKYRGTVGTGGTVNVLPDADPDNAGDVYIAVSDATVPVTYHTGDLLISNGSTWEVVPSGDDLIPIVTSWTNPPSDANIPSEKLVKDSLDAKVDSWEGRPGYETTNLVYAMVNGSDGALNWTNSSPTNFNVAVYHENGELYVADPVHNRDATNKQYVDNAIAGLGLSWSERTADNDWTDLFTVNADNTITALKHIYLNYTSNPQFSGYIPKGLTVNNIKLPAYHLLASSNTITIKNVFSMNYSYIPSSNTRCGQVQGYKFTFTTDGSTVSVAGASDSSNISKASVKVYVSN